MMNSKAKSRKTKKSKSKGREVPAGSGSCSEPSAAPLSKTGKPKSKSPVPRPAESPESIGESPPPPSTRERESGLKRKGLVLDAMIGEIVMPGDELVISSSHGGPIPVVLGPGLSLPVKTTVEDDRDGKEKIAIVNKPGILMKKKANTFYIEMTARNYLPYKNDDAVGVITKRSGDQYVVDIGTRDRVTLSKFAFEGATKKNKPDLKIGDVVFGRFLDLPPDFPFEISCVSGSGKSIGFGPLEAGFLFQIPTPAVKVLQTPKKQGGSDILKKLGDIIPFEMVLGVNGYVWIKTKNDLMNILLSRTVQATADLQPDEHDQLLSHFRTSLESVQGIMKSK